MVIINKDININRNRSKETPIDKIEIQTNINIQINKIINISHIHIKNNRIYNNINPHNLEHWLIEITIERIIIVIVIV